MFEQAAGLFLRPFGEAKALFEAASKGAIREMAHSARLHIRMCDQRLGSAIPEHGDGRRALQLRRGADEPPRIPGGPTAFGAGRANVDQRGDHLHYALALCLGAWAIWTAPASSSGVPSRSIPATARWREATRISPTWLAGPRSANCSRADRGRPLNVALSGKKATAREPLRIVVIGGGTGLSSLLNGLKRYVHPPGKSISLNDPVEADSVDLTAVVTVTDDGGSSGRLRREFDVLPPGDIRNCMVALSEVRRPDLAACSNTASQPAAA